MQVGQDLHHGHDDRAEGDHEPGDQKGVEQHALAREIKHGEAIAGQSELPIWPRVAPTLNITVFMVPPSERGRVPRSHDVAPFEVAGPQ